MSCVSFVLEGPLQAWGTSSRFARRATDDAPSKSGVLGLCASALGRGREEDPSDLAALRFGVRLDQPGRLLRDFQTAEPVEGHTVIGGHNDRLPTSDRYYRADARYLAVLEGDQVLLEQICAALRRPAHPLFLGRKSCPPASPVLARRHATTMEDVLLDAPWLAAERERAHSDGLVEIRLDSTTPPHPRIAPLIKGTSTAADVPVSWHWDRRIHGRRTITHAWVNLAPEQPSSAAAAVLEPANVSEVDHDPFVAVLAARTRYERAA